MTKTYSRPLRYSRPALLMGAVGLGRGRSRVAVDDDALEIRMGWGFRLRAPRASVDGAEVVRGRRPLSRGVHGWAGRWLVTGAGDRLVRIRFRGRVAARTAVFPLRVREVVVSVDDPETLADALRGVPAGGA